MPAVSFRTYVDARTTVATNSQDMVRATQLLSELDELSGQKEDPTKEEMAFVNAPMPAFQIFPSARTDYLDLLGIRLDLNGSAPPILAPKAKARMQQLSLRLDRLRKVSKCLHLGKGRIQRAVASSLALLRWDAAWIDCSLSVFYQTTTKIELALQGRKRFAAWRHRGAAWVVQRQGWKLEPVALAIFAAVFAARRMQKSQWCEGFRAAWSGDFGARSCLASRLRDAYAKLHWGATESPCVVLLPQGRSTSVLLVRLCSAIFYVRVGGIISCRIAFPLGMFVLMLIPSIVPRFILSCQVKRALRRLLLGGVLLRLSPISNV